MTEILGDFEFDSGFDGEGLEGLVEDDPSLSLEIDTEIVHDFSDGDVQANTLIDLQDAQSSALYSDSDSSIDLQSISAELENLENKEDNDLRTISDGIEEPDVLGIEYGDVRPISDDEFVGSLVSHGTPFEDIKIHDQRDV